MVAQSSFEKKLNDGHGVLNAVPSRARVVTSLGEFKGARCDDDNDDDGVDDGDDDDSLAFTAAISTSTSTSTTTTTITNTTTLYHTKPYHTTR